MTLVQHARVGGFNFTPGDSRGTSSVMVRRPDSFPGLSTDLAYAQELQKRNDSGTAIALFLLGAMAGTAQAWADSQESRRNSMVDCVSRRDGTTTYTNCY